MNLPNKLTVVRIVLTPFFLAAMLLKLNYNINYLIAAVIFIAASVTDFLDGRIARKTALLPPSASFATRWRIKCSPPLRCLRSCSSACATFG